ncbi:MAG TPA: CpaD family pilus assembly protein [Hyphomicrobiaceae bacterium]|jgi:pilus assembly protein CpaD|nr:CpaD family pilus assembly protein [Hyphomicrobiaceae bacterium]
MTIRTRASFAPRAWLSLVALAALALTACDESRRLDNEMAVGLNNAEQRHPIRFTSRSESLDVEVPPGVEGLSRNQHVDVYRFLERFRREARGRLTITAPTNVRDRASLAHSLQDIQRHVVDAGIDYHLVRVGKIGPQVDGAPAIRLAYHRPVAIGPRCGDWSEDLGRYEERVSYPNWGCATQRNLAVMIDNARDMQEPQAEDPRPGERRSVVWSSYVSGGQAKADSGGSTAEAAKPSAPALKK